MTSTMPVEAEYIQGSDLPDLEVVWADSAGELIDMSTGHTFEVKVGILDQATEFTKVSGVTGTPFGCVVSWNANGDLNTLPLGRYTLEITATRTIDNRQRKTQVSLKLKPKLT